MLTPQKLYTVLSQYVIGQEEAKRVLSCAVYSHFLNIKHNISRPSSVLMIGPTGVGKTYLVECLAKILKIPLLITSATVYTEAGYIGEDVENIIIKLYEKTYNKELTEKGIVFIDELDKLTEKKGEPILPQVDYTVRNPVGIGVQQALLPLLHGQNIELEDAGKKFTINTKGIFFIGAGVFTNLKDIIRKRIIAKVNPSIELSPLQIYSQAIFDDFLTFGYIPEFIGRFPTIVALDNLTKEDFKRILLESLDSPLEYYTTLFATQGKKLVFEDKIIDEIVSRAITKRVGARGLWAVVNKLMQNYIFDIDKLPREVKVSF